MCGRVRTPGEWAETKIRLRFDERYPAPNLRRSWNVSPTQEVLVCRRDPETGKRKPDLMRWGVVNELGRSRMSNQTALASAVPDQSDLPSDCFLCAPNARLVFWTGASFLAMAGLGPVTDGYSLIGTRDHVKSMADVDDRDSEGRDDALAMVRRNLSRLFGEPCLITEHGRVPVCKDNDHHRHDAHCFHAHFLAFPQAPDVSKHARSYFRTHRAFDQPRAALAYARSCAF